MVLNIFGNFISNFLFINLLAIRRMIIRVKRVAEILVGVIFNPSQEVKNIIWVIKPIPKRGDSPNRSGSGRSLTTT
jgi:hypothetical protein